MEKDYSLIRTFLCDIGWRIYVGTNEKFKTILKNSDRTVVAFYNLKVVGFARAICDNELNGYITMVAVSPSMRCKGIGTQLVIKLIGNNNNIKWVLTSNVSALKFWEKVGFIPLLNGLVMPRDIKF